MLRAMDTRSLVVIVLYALFVGGCSAEPHTADYAVNGSFGIGVHTFTFVDRSRATPANGNYAGDPVRTLVVDMWYPSTMAGGPYTDPPFAGGQYPLILHSHGLMDSRRNEAYLGEQLASRGYIVAAPDYPLSNGTAPGGATVADTAQQPLDARFVIDQLLAAGDDPSSPFFGAFDATRIGASGLSLGGLTTLLLAYHPRLRDPRVSAAMAMAAPSCMLEPAFFRNVDPPLLLVHGDSDLVVPIDANSRRLFPLTPSPSELVVLQNASHTGFAGPALLLDPSMHLDTFACTALGTLTVSSFATLGSADEGIAQDPAACAPPCQVAPAGLALSAKRQQELTRALAQAFFDGNLRGVKVAREFVHARVALENPEVTLKWK
jgi:predicted dienelactone hydrolase